MEQRAELKTKARELERNGQVEAALELYRRIASEAHDGGSGPLWARIGDLQERLGQRDSAADSYSRAVASFADAGQKNNAIALCCALLRLDAESPGAQLRLGELSLAEGYREFARDGIGAFARQVATTDDADTALEPVAAFLRRFPDEHDLWRDWTEELVGLGKEDEAVAILRRLAEIASEHGIADTAARLNEAIRKIRPGAADPGTAALPSVDDGSRGAEATEPEESELPLLGHDVPGARSLEPEVSRLEGFEPTRAVDADEPGDAYPQSEALPYLDPTAARPEEAAGESVAADDPFPLLGFGLEEDDSAPRENDAGALPLLEPTEVERDFRLDAPSEPEPPLPLLGNESPDFASGSPIGDEHGEEASTPTVLDDAGAPEAWKETAVEDLLPAAASDAAEETSFEDVVEELLSLSTEEVEPVDAGTHYDLGLAFKEMGRFEEALGNLALAIRGGHDPVATLEVVGEMLVDRGRHDLVTRLLSGIPGAGERPAAELLGVHHRLARAAEAEGRGGEARRALDLVVAVDPDFRDASARAAELADPHFDNH